MRLEVKPDCLEIRSESDQESEYLHNIARYTAKIEWRPGVFIFRAKLPPETGTYSCQATDDEKTESPPEKVVRPTDPPVFKVGQKVRHRGSGEVGIVEEPEYWGEEATGPPPAYRVAVGFRDSERVPTEHLEAVEEPEEGSLDTQELAKACKTALDDLCRLMIPHLMFKGPLPDPKPMMDERTEQIISQVIETLRHAQESSCSFEAVTPKTQNDLFVERCQKAYRLLIKAHSPAPKVEVLYAKPEACRCPYCDAVQALREAFQGIGVNPDSIRPE